MTRRLRNCRGFLHTNRSAAFAALCAAAFAALFAYTMALIATAFPSTALAADEEATTVKVGYYENEVFQEGAHDGAIKTGYAYEYYRKISEYTGWKYDYAYGVARVDFHLVEGLNLLQAVVQEALDVLHRRTARGYACTSETERGHPCWYLNLDKVPWRKIPASSMRKASKGISDGRKCITAGCNGRRRVERSAS